jgi:hypothetical protein
MKALNNTLIKKSQPQTLYPYNSRKLRIPTITLLNNYYQLEYQKH